MPEVSSYKPGQFCWVELSTTDAKSAKSFYTNLFGWKVNENPMGDQGIYYMFQVKGKDAAAMYEQSPDEKKSGIPPHWNNYVSVKSVDDAANKVKSLGGNVVAGPFDVYDFGRMAFVTDSQGAMFALWEPKKHIGATILGDPGTLSWNELYAPSSDNASKFYGSLFGWTPKKSPEYTEFHLGEKAIGGMMETTGRLEGMPANWMPYFNVADTDATVQKAKASGAQVHHPPTDIPEVGRFAVLADPQGAAFAIIALRNR